MFVLIFPVLFGLTAFSIDSSRGIQTNTRLGDAMDSAVLAVTADEHASTGLDNELVNTYIKSYIPDSKMITNKVDLKPCDGVDGCTEYSAAGQVTLETWFPENEVFIGHKDEMLVSESSKAKKITPAEIGDIEIVVALDIAAFSNREMNTGNFRITRLNAYKEAVRRMTKKLAEYKELGSKSRISIMPFGDGIMTQFDDGSQCVLRQFDLKYQYPDSPSDSDTKLEAVNNWNSGREWDTSKTVDNTLVEKDPSWCRRAHDDPRNGDFGDNGFWQVNTGMSSYAVELPPTDDFDYVLEVMDKLHANSSGNGTIFDPLVRGFQILKQSEVQNKLFVWLSDNEDGAEWYSNYNNHLVSGGMCEMMHEDIKTTPSGKEVDFNIVSWWNTSQRPTQSHNSWVFHWFNKCIREPNEENYFEAILAASGFTPDYGLEDFYTHLDKLIDEAVLGSVEGDGGPVDSDKDEVGTLIN